MKIYFKPLLFIFLFSISFYGKSAPSDFDIIKRRVVDAAKGNYQIDDEMILHLIETLNDDGTWPGIDYEDVSNEGFQHRKHSSNLVALSRAYAVKSSKFYRNRKVKNTVELALKHWADNDYICDNWWHNQVGTPNDLVQVMLLIGDQLPKDLVAKTQPIIGRAHIDAPGARPGGDRIKISGIQAKNLLFLGDKETFEKVINVIENEIYYVEWIGRNYGYTYRYHSAGFGNRTPGGRGIQYGNSFHHRADGVNNTLSYGLGYADAFIEWAIYTVDTEFAFSDERLETLVDYYLDGISKTAVFGKFPDPGEENRSISRRGALRPLSAAPAERLLLTTSYRKDELQEIVEIRRNDAKPTRSHATFFWNTEHFSYQRPDWFTSVRMYSTRTHNMEEPYNSEGLLNHHKGDGANHISTTGTQYYDIFPVFDYQKFPGTTIMQKAELPAPNQIQKLGETDFVGAATDGTYGAVAFDFKSPHDPLIARKSWFMFDDEYMCLGAGISCKQQLPVVTTLNQSLLRGDVVLSSDNQNTKLEKGEKQYDNVDWIFHDGIGYVFPDPTRVELKNGPEKGSWWRISKQTSTPKEEVTMDVFKLWIDHGKRPSDATYEYMVVPATSVDELKQNSSKNNVSILENNYYVQAVLHKELDMLQAVFYKGGEVSLNGNLKLEAHNPGIIMVKFQNGYVSEVTVADPNRELSKFNFSISTKIENNGENFSSLWNETEGVSHISIALPQDNYAGSSITIKL